ncbi:MAG: winged helix-turn-helix transcriptional regulator [Actinomycetota bacterium]
MCAHFQRAAEIVGRRWTPQIVRVLLVGPARYRDLRAGIPSISDHLLSARLKELEAAGIVSRSVDPGTPVRIEYTLTPAGEALAEVIVALAEWAERWAGSTRAGQRRSVAGGRSK